MQRELKLVVHRAGAGIDGMMHGTEALWLQPDAEHGEPGRSSGGMPLGHPKQRTTFARLLEQAFDRNTGEQRDGKSAAGIEGKIGEVDGDRRLDRDRGEPKADLRLRGVLRPVGHEQIDDGNRPSDRSRSR